MPQYDNSLEIVLLNKDPNSFTYYPENFKNPSTNSTQLKKHIKSIIARGTPMTQEFLAIVQKFTPELYDSALKLPMYSGQEVNSKGANLIKFNELLKGSAENNVAEDNTGNVENSISNVELDKVEEELAVAVSQEEFDPVSEDSLNPSFFSADTVQNEISTSMLQNESDASVISNQRGEDNVSNAPSMIYSNFGTDSGRGDFSPEPSEIGGSFGSSSVPQPNQEINPPVPSQGPNATDFAVPEVKDEHAPKYHLDSILFYFGSKTKPDWDFELQENVFNSKLTHVEIVRNIDAIIKNYGSILFVYENKSSSLAEFHELIQLQFCYIRNLSRGSRTKMAMVPISSLTNFANKLNGPTEVRNDFVQPLEGADSVSQADQGNQVGTMPQPEQLGNQVQIPVLQNKVVEAYRNRPYGLYGKPVTNPIVNDIRFRKPVHLVKSNIFD
jgi:hypothetical protein